MSQFEVGHRKPEPTDAGSGHHFGPRRMGLSPCMQRSQGVDPETFTHVFHLLSALLVEREICCKSFESMQESVERKQ